MKKINIPKVEFYTKVRELIENEAYDGFCHAIGAVIFNELGYSDYVEDRNKDENLNLKDEVWDTVQTLLESNDANKILYDIAKYNPYRGDCVWFDQFKGGRQKRLDILDEIIATCKGDIVLDISNA